MIGKRIVILATILSCSIQTLLSAPAGYLQDWKRWRNYYDVLGVTANASTDEIKKAYRKLSTVKHPDRGGTTEEFQELQAAFDTLKDDQYRKEYNNFLNAEKASRAALTLSTSTVAPEKTADKFTFEFKNKLNEPVSIELYPKGSENGLFAPYTTGNAFMEVAASKGSKESDHGYLRAIGIKAGDKFILKVARKGKATIIYEIAPNDNRKRILLTFDKNLLRNLVLEPQKGEKGKTQSGIPLDGNVTKSEIK